MSTFGWSAGDVLATTKIVGKIKFGSKEAGGASDQYTQTVWDLETLRIILHHLKDFTT
jgi:hypothetical protein